MDEAQDWYQCMYCDEIGKHTPIECNPRWKECKKCGGYKHPAIKTQEDITRVFLIDREKYNG